MLRILKCGLCAIAAFTAGCQTSNKSAAKDIVFDVDGKPGPIDCGAGKAPLAYQLNGQDFVPSRSDIGLKGEITELRGQRAERDNLGYRLDLCVDDATSGVFLQRMVQRQPSPSPWMTMHNLFMPDSVNEQAAWADALGNGGSPDLSVTFRDQNNAKRSVLLHGWKAADGTLFVTVSTFDANGGDPLVLAPGTVAYGRLVEGDPWAFPTYVEHNRTVESAAIKIDLYYELQEGNNGYKEYRVQTIRIVDRSPNLATPYTAELSGDALTSVLNVIKTHHSLTDAFQITLPHATYRIGQGLQVTYKGKTAETFDVGCQAVADCGKPMDLPRPQ